MSTEPSLFKSIRLTTLLVPVLVAACSDDGPMGRANGGPDTGAVEAATATTGEAIDPDGYALSVDGGSEQAIGVDTALTISGLAPGNHVLELTGVAANCNVTGSNPRTVLVTAGRTARTTFAVSCTSLGALDVTVVTDDFPLRAVAVTVTGSGGPRNGTTRDDGTVLFEDLPAGPYVVVATVGGGPCTSQPATVIAAQTTEVTVICDPGTVRGQVTVNGAGEPGVTVAIFTITTTTGPDGRYEFVIGPLDPGFNVAIVPPAGATCPKTFEPIVLPPGGTVTVNFACTR